MTETALNLDNLSVQELEFKNTLSGASIPTTEEALKAEFQTLATDQGVLFSNDSAYSPFWRLIKAVVTVPVLWLIAFLVRFVMPNMFAKTATGAYLDLLSWGYKVERKPASKLTGQVVFNRGTLGAGQLVEAGAWIRTVAINGTVYRVQVTTAIEFDSQSTSVLVPVEAEIVGSGFNLAAGYFTILELPMAGITAVTNESDWIVVPGADQETDDDLRLRMRNQFSAVNQFHTDAVYRAMIAAQVGISADQIFFEHTAPRGPASVNAHVLFDSGVVSSTYLTQINDFITDQGNHGHGDDLQVVAMPAQNEAVTATAYYSQTLPATELAALQQGIEQFIRSAFRENTDYTATRTWHFSRFSFSKLDKELHQQFPSLLSIDWGQGDIITGLAVARLTTLNLTWVAEAL